MAEEICIHLACGKRYLPGWIHVDIDDHPHIDYRHSIDKLPMFSHDYADLIYASHVIAYWDRFEVVELFCEWLRVLKPNGVLRLSTPDFEKVVQIYQKTGDLGLLHGFLHGRYVTKDGPIYYKTIHDQKTLEQALLDAGFKSVRNYDWRATIHKDYDDYSQSYLPHMDKEHGLMMSLNVEATKP